MIDLRSDTVTLPTKKMRKSMMNATVGDDVYEDDPSVKKLEKKAAKMLGKEDALFVPSGTFGNQLCIMTHTKRGDEIIADKDSHIVLYEVGASAGLSSVHTRCFTCKDGYSNPNDIEALIRAKNVHFPDTGLICLENARSDGTVISLKNMQEIQKVAKKHKIPLHLDGARFFNAAHALDVGYKEFASLFDSVSICLSKGLAAPIGSLIVGRKKFIEKARRNRKLMGGGLRQVGVLAAPALIALEKMSKRIGEDNVNAAYLAHRLNDFPDIKVDFDHLSINMVFFELPLNVIKPEVFAKKLLKKGIKIGINGYSYGAKYRFLTHYQVSKEDIDYLVACIKEIVYGKEK